MKKPAGIFFDWDGTLTEGFGAIFEGHNAALRHFNLPVLSPEELQLQIRLSGRESYPKIFGNNWEEALSIFRAYVLDHHLDHLQIIAHVPELLGFLKDAKIPMGIISNKTHDILLREVTHLDWDGYFTTIIGAGFASKDKPSPEPLLLAASKADLDPKLSELWYVGDTETDMQAARLAGFTPVFIAHGLGKKDQLDQWPPSCVVSDAKALIQQVRELL